MRKEVYVLYLLRNGVYTEIVSSDQEESVEEFVDLYLSIITDLLEEDYEDQELVDTVVNKLVNREYRVEVQSDKDTDYIVVMVEA